MTTVAYERDLAAWMIKWRENAYNDREFTPIEISQAVEHFRAGVDAHESAAAIMEGHTGGALTAKRRTRGRTR